LGEALTSISEGALEQRVVAQDRVQGGGAEEGLREVVRARAGQTVGGRELVQMLVARPGSFHADVVTVAQRLIVFAEDAVVRDLRLAREILARGEAGGNVRRKDRLSILLEILE